MLANMEGGEKLLYDMFPTLDRVVVSNVFIQCKHDLDASINFLLDIASNSKYEPTVSNNGKEYVNASYWGGTNTNIYDAPSYSQGAGKYEADEEAVEMERVLEYLARKFGPDQPEDFRAKEQERQKEREAELESERERERQRAKDREREWQEERKRSQEKLRETIDQIKSNRAASPMSSEKPGSTTTGGFTFGRVASMRQEKEQDDESFRWRCGECLQLNSMKRFSCEGCLSLRDMAGEKVKVEKEVKEEEEEEKPEKKSVLNIGRYVFKDGKYEYVKKGGEEEKGEDEEVQPERVSSKYSFCYSTTSSSKKEKSKEEEEDEGDKETPGERKYQFGGRYVYLGGKYVYIKDGQKTPTEEDVYRESFLHKKAEEKQASAAPGFHPYHNAANSSMEEAAKVAWMLNCKNYYLLLGVPRNASLTDIKASYKKLALLLHPDRNSTEGSEEAFKALSQAFSCLSNPELRRAYDVYGNLAEQRIPTPTAAGSDLTEEEVMRAYIFLRSMFNPFNAKKF